MKDGQREFSSFFLDTEDGLAKIEIDLKYKDFNAKQDFPWVVILQLEVIDPNEVNHPESTEVEELDEIEQVILELLSSTQSVHHVARIAIDGWRDTILYIDKPTFPERSMTKLLDEINEDRGINFSLEQVTYHQYQ